MLRLFDRRRFHPMQKEAGLGPVSIGLLSDVGAGGLVVLFVILVLTGRLVWHKEVQYWREAFFEEQRQKRELLESGKVTQDVLRAIPEALERRRNS